MDEVLTALLRINDRLEGLERLLRAQLEHTRDAETRVQRMFRALAMIAGDHVRHDD